MGSEPATGDVFLRQTGNGLDWDYILKAARISEPGGTQELRNLMNSGVDLWLHNTRGTKYSL